MMRLRFWAMLAGFLMATAVQADRGPAVPDYPADKVAENVYVIHGPVTTPNEQNQGFMNNPGFVLTEKGVVIVDPGGTLQSGEMTLRVIRKITDKPVLATFNTHVHGDHWLGNQAVKKAYPDAPIYAHPNLIREAAEGEGQRWVDLMMNLSKGKSAGTEFVNATHEINHGDKFTLGDTTFEIYHYGVAHTDTDIMISVDGGKALFMGDNLVNGRLGNTRDGNIKDLIEANEKVVAAVKPKVIVPGHGPSGGMEMFNHSLDFFRILYTTVQRLFEEDLADYEMKPQVAEALKDYKDWEDIDALLGKSINQAYLEIEAADF